MKTRYSRTPARLASALIASAWPALASGLMVLALGSAAMAEDKAPAEATKAPPPPAVLVAAVETQLIDHQGRFIGTIQAIQQVEVQARVEGFLEQVAFDQGSTVKTGQLLYQIEQAPFQAQLDAANAELASAVAELAGAQASLLDAQAQFDRFTALVKKGDTSESEFDRSRAQRDMAQANVEKAQAAELQARAEIQTAQINLGYTTITSAIDGRVGQTNYTVGNLVGPSSKVLATVVQIDPIRAVFSIPSADFVRVTEQAGKNSGTYGNFIPELILPTGATYAEKGRIAFVDNQINAATGSIAIYADFPNPDGVLLPGQFITTIIHTAKQQRQPVVPAGAVIQTKDGQQVYVVGPDNRVSLRTIKTGGQVGSNFAVSAGLTEGEIVVVSGIQKIKSGMIVAPTPADGTGGAAQDASQSGAATGPQASGSDQSPAPASTSSTPESSTTGPTNTEPTNSGPTNSGPTKADPSPSEQDSTADPTATKTGG